MANARLPHNVGLWICEECNAEITRTWNGRPRRFCSQPCKARWLTKHRKSPIWWSKTRKGYILVFQPKHPFASKAGYVMEHRLVMERVLDRYLEPYEVVNHKNEIKDDNRFENLEVLTKVAHDRLSKPLPKTRPIECPHCGGEIMITARALYAVAPSSASPTQSDLKSS